METDDKVVDLNAFINNKMKCHISYETYDYNDEYMNKAIEK